MKKILFGLLLALIVAVLVSSSFSSRKILLGHCIKEVDFTVTEDIEYDVILAVDSFSDCKEERILQNYFEPFNEFNRINYLCEPRLRYKLTCYSKSVNYGPFDYSYFTNYVYFYIIKSGKVKVIKRTLTSYEYPEAICITKDDLPIYEFNDSSNYRFK